MNGIYLSNLITNNHQQNFFFLPLRAVFKIRLWTMLHVSRTIKLLKGNITYLESRKQMICTEVIKFFPVRQRQIPKSIVLYDLVENTKRL